MRVFLGACLLAGVVHSLQPDESAAQMADEFLKKAKDALSKGDAKAALNLAGQAIARDPKHEPGYLFRGVVYESLQRHTEAVQDFDKAIELNPQTAEAYDRRGSEHFKLGHIQESLKDFDKFLELRPAAKPGHWKRGISLYYAGRFEDGRKQFEGYQTVDSNDVENAVWRFLCMARESGVDKARSDMLKIGKDPRVPLMQVYALYHGQAKPEDVLEAVRQGQPNDSERKSRLFYAHLYLGLYAEVIGDKKKALEHLKAAEDLPIGGYMWDVARVHRALLEKK
jgi:lipoprotein NlpI